MKCHSLKNKKISNKIYVIKNKKRPVEYEDDNRCQNQSSAQTYWSDQDKVPIQGIVGEIRLAVAAPCCTLGEC